MTATGRVRKVCTSTLTGFKALSQRRIRTSTSALGRVESPFVFQGLIKHRDPARLCLSVYPGDQPRSFERALFVPSYSLCR